ncbi:MAG: hypothetical protein Q7K34_04050 [archaeon]|nr:hypothetical protein [archaeon]
MVQIYQDFQLSRKAGPGYFFKRLTQGLLFMLRKKHEGRALPKTPELVAWEKEFQKMSLVEHVEKLRGLGLTEEDLSEFNAVFKKTRQQTNK